MDADYGYGYYYNVPRRHVPAFGAWDWSHDMQLTQCFESPNQPAFLRCSFSDNEDQDSDLYVTGDLYDNRPIGPAVIVVPRRKQGKRKERSVKEAVREQSWEENDVQQRQNYMTKPVPKPVDEDLYKISPELLFAKPRKKRGLGFIPSCFLPNCVC